MKGFNVFMIDFSWLSSERSFMRMQEEDVAVKPLSNVQQQHELAILQKKIAYETIRVSALLLWTWFIILYSKPMEGWWHEELSFFKLDSYVKLWSFYRLIAHVLHLRAKLILSLFGQVSQNGQTCSTLCKKKKKKSSHRLLSSRRSLLAGQREAFSLHSVSEQEDLVTKWCGMDCLTSCLSK